jgi:hypothetical protein
MSIKRKMKNGQMMLVPYHREQPIPSDRYWYSHAGEKTFSLVIWSVLGLILQWLNAGVEGLGFSAILALPRFIDSPRTRPTNSTPQVPC